MYRTCHCNCTLCDLSLALPNKVSFIGLISFFMQFEAHMDFEERNLQARHHIDHCHQVSLAIARPLLTIPSKLLLFATKI